jgi:hypothetical protein
VIGATFGLWLFVISIDEGRLAYMVGVASATAGTKALLGSCAPIARPATGDAPSDQGSVHQRVPRAGAAARAQPVAASSQTVTSRVTSSRFTSLKSSWRASG